MLSSPIRSTLIISASNLLRRSCKNSSSAMLPGDFTGLIHHHQLAPDQNNPIPFPGHANYYGAGYGNTPSLHFGRYLSNPTAGPIPAAIHEFTPPSTSDEAEEQEHHQVSIIDERKQRRMISNRESARRSRMRKQKHLDELWSQVVRLRNENHCLIDKLNHVSECHDRVLQENARLKEEASDLRQMLTDLRIGSPYTTLRELDGVSCNTAHLRAESSTQSITTSIDLLH